MTQEELAVKIGVSKSAVAKWETDGGLPDRDNLKKLAEAISLSVDELHNVIGGSGKPGGTELQINITSDVITTLEANGYKVIRPEGKSESVEGGNVHD